MTQCFGAGEEYADASYLSGRYKEKQYTFWYTVFLWRAVRSSNPQPSVP